MNITGMKSAVPEFIKKCTDELAQRLLRKVILRTPVGKKPTFTGEKTIKVKGQSGYSGGHLRRSWRISKAQGTGYNYTITVENPVEYASYVEHGHRQTPGRFIPALGKKAVVSWVRGRHMLSDSVNELEDSKYKIIDNKLKAFLKERMNV